MRLASWNINSLKVRLPQVLEWLVTSNCDVLALQELKLDNDSFPVAAFSELGYYCVFNGQKTYNGVALISKIPLQDIEYDIPDYNDIQKRVITATVNGIRVMCIYVVNGESIDSPKFQYKLLWLESLHNYIEKALKKYPLLAVMGDFNIAPLDIDVYDPIILQGKVLCSDLERNAWSRLINLGLYDSFRLFSSEDRQYTWWDYRNVAFRRKLGLRIDHILISDALKQKAINCEIDINPRKNERPSDHTPIILSLDNEVNCDTL